MESNCIKMHSGIEAHVNEKGVILGRQHNNTFAEFLMFQIVPLYARAPYEVTMKYKMIDKWEDVGYIGPHDSLRFLTKLAEGRFNCPIPDEVCDAIEALRLARKMLLNDRS